MKDFMKVLSNVFSFTKSEVRVIIFISAVISAGYIVKFYGSLTGESDKGTYDYSEYDNEFRERSLKIYADDNKKRDTSSSGERELYGKLTAAEKTLIQKKETEAADGSEGTADFTIDINTAGADELTELPGIGESIAERILEYREANKRFASVKDLMKVKGIGRKKFEKIKKFVKAD